MIVQVRKRSVKSQNDIGLEDVKIGPTVERLRRDRFSRSGEALRIVTTVDRLHKAGEISDDALAAARRWRCEYEYAELGTIDPEYLCSSGQEKGDVHTWMLGRGKCADRLKKIRQGLGAALSVRIEMMLVREMSFPAMAELMFPACPKASARIKVAAQCALTLEKLSELYRKKY